MYYQNIYKYDDMKRSEHMAVRQNVGWYLWTHQLIEVTGNDASAFLDLLFAKPIGTLKIGKERYTTMLDEQAEIIDDVVVFRLAENTFWISTLFAPYMLNWMNMHKGDFQVAYQDITEKYHMYAVQGPLAKDMLNKLVKNNIDEQKFFSIADNEINNIPVKINRAGFTGEKWGYEIYVPAEQADAMEEFLRTAGAEFNAKEVTEFQIMAWTLPTEAGFYYMRDLRHTNPLEVGLEKGIDWEKDFIGKEALLKIKETGPQREMLGFTIDEADIFIKGRHYGGPGEAVYVNDEEIGRVYKIVYSYVLEKNIGYILAKKGVLNIGDHIDIHGHEAVIVDKPFI